MGSTLSAIADRSLRLSELDGLVVARRMIDTGAADTEEAWSLDRLAGRFAELSGGVATAGLTSAAGLILETQARGELAAWIEVRDSIFFPPDFAAAGIDVEALPVIRAPSAVKAARIADTLLRSGGFALIVMDANSLREFSIAIQTRLAGLAKQHHTAVVCLTRQNERERAAGSMVSIRAESERQRSGFNRFLCDLRTTKDKQRTPGKRQREMCRGPDGLC